MWSAHVAGGIVMERLWQRLVQWIKGRRPTRAGLLHFWHEHGVALLLYAVLSVAVSWPLVRNFTTRLLSDGRDPRHQLWVLWHTREWVLGRQPLFSTQLLYYPVGIPLLLHSAGPVPGIFALPFWGLGPEAAYNGAVLVGLWLTGYCMYLLARGLGFDRGVALFAGIVLVVAPIHLAGLYSHLERIFLGWIPLTLLTWHRALDTGRNAGWAAVTSLVLLLTALSSGYQFVYALLAVGFFLVVAWLAGGRAERRLLLRRVALFLISTLVLVGPFLVVTVKVARNPAFEVETNMQSLYWRPDLLQYFLPATHSLLFRSLTEKAMAPYVKDYPIGLDTAVSLLWTGVILSIVGWVRGPRLARRWLVFTVSGVILSLGPVLRAFGRTSFTEYRLPITLPYAFLTALPGLEFMRITGRFMMPAYVGLAVSAGFGMTWLKQRFPKLGRWVLLLAAVLLLLEGWPKPWPQEVLPPVPAFYQQIAQDKEPYGVFDLPSRSAAGFYTDAASSYQWFQMTHGKGIASGYLSRTYARHPFWASLAASCAPLAPPDVWVNGRPPGDCRAVLRGLARLGYRYVVWHKTFFGGYDDQVAEAEFLRAAFDGQAPLVDDALVRVYQLSTFSGTADLTTTVVLTENWQPIEGEVRWATSPASVIIQSAKEQPALLEITLASVHDPSSKTGESKRGTLLVWVGQDGPVSAEVVVGRTTIVPLLLPQGEQGVTLSLEAGNFRPADYGMPDTRTLSFAIRLLNLWTLDGTTLPSDILVGGEPEREGGEVVGVYGGNWYDFEGAAGVRWASSPADLFLYSRTPRQVELRLLPVYLYAPGSEGGLGAEGAMQVDLEGGEAVQRAVRVRQPLAIPLQLRAGWNRVVLALEAGNFRPRDVQPCSRDERRLSFALGWVDVVLK